MKAIFVGIYFENTYYIYAFTKNSKFISNESQTLKPGVLEIGMFNINYLILSELHIMTNSQAVS
jgi:hypothetical protein